MLENFNKTLSKTHLRRLDNLLWSKKKKAILQMKGVVPNNEFLLAMKRLELQDSKKVRSKKITVSEEDWSNPGTLLDLSNALHNQKKYTEIIKMKHLDLLD